MAGPDNGKLRKALSTLSLVQKARSGDQQAFGDLVGRHQHRLLSLIYLRLGPRLRRKIEPEDVYQETVLKAFQALRQLEWQGKEPFFQWLGAIAEHVIKNQVRLYFLTRKRGGSPAGDPPIPEDAALELEGVPDADMPSPSRALRRYERFQRLEDALRRLKKDHREVIILARLRGLSIREIAGRMKRSREAVSMLLLRALHQLKAAFGETDSLHLPPFQIEVSSRGNGCACPSGRSGPGGGGEVAPEGEDPGSLGRSPSRDARS